MTVSHREHKILFFKKHHKNHTDHKGLNGNVYIQLMYTFGEAILM